MCSRAKCSWHRIFISGSLISFLFAEPVSSSEAICSVWSGRSIGGDVTLFRQLDWEQGSWKTPGCKNSRIGNSGMCLNLLIFGWISHFQANSQKSEIHNLRKHQSKVCKYLRKSIIVAVVQIQAFNETGVDASMARVLADGQKSEELHRSCNELKVMIEVGRQYLIVVCRRSWRTKLKNSIHKLQCSSMSRRRLNPTRRG